LKKTWTAGLLGVLSIFPTAVTTEVEDVDGGPQGGAGWILKAATTEDEEDVDDGPPEGCCRYFQQRPPPKLKTSMAGLLGVLAEVRQQPPPKIKKTSMAGLLVVLAESLTATTIEDEEDIDDGSPGGCCRYFR
jgi:hypothetical protein